MPRRPRARRRRIAPRRTSGRRTRRSRRGRPEEFVAWVAMQEVCKPRAAERAWRSVTGPLRPRPWRSRRRGSWGVRRRIGRGGAGSRRLARIPDLVLLHFAIERGTVEAEDLRRFLLVPVRALQRLQDGHLLD